MKPAFRAILLAAIGVCWTLCLARADEGLWLFNQPPTQILKEKYDFKLTDSFLERLQKATVRIGRGGSGSFVSADGLVLTNHHVAQSWLEELWTEKRDLVETGFYAGRREQELRCPGLDVRVVWSIEDVTARVQAAVKADMTPAQVRKTRMTVMHAIEKESTLKTGLASEVTTLFQGGRYHLHRSKRYTDVRLVFAPAKKAVEPAGAKPEAGLQDVKETICDKFDVSFFRVYENGKPARCAHFLPFAPAVPRQNDLVLAAGFPGTTNRFLSAADLDEMYGREYLLSFKSANRELAAVESFANQSAENASLARDELELLTSEAAHQTSVLQNLERQLAEKRSQEKADYAQLLAEDRDLAAQQRQALKRIEAAVRAGEGAYRRYFFLEDAAFRTRLFAFAQYLLRATGAAIETDGYPLPESRRQEDLDDLRGQFFSPRPIVRQLEIAKLEESLDHFASQAPEDADLLAKILNGKAPEKCAQDLINGSHLHELAARQALLKGGKKAVLESMDPMIVLARLVEKRARQLEREYDEKTAEPCVQAYAILHQARVKTATGPVYPDASHSLRLSFGKVLATAETLSELFSQYQMPENWHAARERVNSGTPLSVKISADGAPGSSGSPVLDREGRIVGIIATGMTSSLAYEEAKFFCGTVGARGILEVLDKIYEAKELVKELGGNIRTRENSPTPVQPPPGPPGLPNWPQRPSVVKRYKELIPALVKSLKDTDSEVVQAAAQALGNIGAEAVPAMLEALRSRDKTLRANAALALGKTGYAAQIAIPDLLKALQDDEVIVRREAARALAAVVQEPSIIYGPPPFPPGPPPNGAPIVPVPR